MLGLNGRRILDGLVHRHSVERILKKLTWHMRDKLEPIARTFEAELSILTPVWHSSTSNETKADESQYFIDSCVALRKSAG